MKEQNSFYEDWYNSFPFYKKINRIIFDNFLKEKAIHDKTYLTWFMSSFYLSKADFYLKRFEKKVNKLGNTIHVSDKAIKTHLLFEAKRLNFHCLDLMPNGTDERFYQEKTVLKDLSIIQYFKNLEILDCYGQDVFNLAPLSNFPHLKELTLYSDIKYPNNDVVLTYAAAIKKLHQLRYLNLSGNFISNFREIENSTIEYLELRSTNFKTLTDLSSLSNLKLLEIAETKVNSLNGIEMFKDLEILCLGNNEISDYSPILKLPKLKLVTIYDDDEEKKNKMKSELLKLEGKNENLICKVEYQFGLGFYKDLKGSIEAGLQFRLSDLTRC